MTGKTFTLSEKTLTSMWKDWMNIISRRENGLLLFAPRTDRLYRIDNFLQSSDSVKTKKYVLYLQNSRLEDEKDWIQFIDSFKKERPDVFLIADAELLFTEKSSLFPVISSWYRIHQDSSFLLFSEKYPYNYSLHSFIHQTIYHPLYGRTDLQVFLDYLSRRFSISLSKTMRDRIIVSTSGHLWLIKHIVRFLSQNPHDDPWQDPALKVKIKEILKGLTIEEQKQLNDVAQGNPPGTTLAARHLASLGMINLHRSSLLYTTVRGSKISHVTLSLKGNDFVINDIPITKFFSRQEQQALHFLLAHKGKRISRDEMAQAFWGEEKYIDSTNWALDQAVKRLRGKLQELRIGDSWIVTKKGIGYELH